MVVVLASRLDDGARVLVSNLQATGAAALVVPRDLSVAGWCLRVPGGAATLSVNNALAAASDLTGIVVRLSHVGEEELPHIVSEDRAYVAAETTAFLHAWLNAVRVPMLNPPGANCLCGPGWVADQWRFAAAAAGIPLHRVSPAQTPFSNDLSRPALETVLAVGNLTMGSDDPVYREWTRRLSRTAGAPMLAAHFSGRSLVTADTFPDITRSDVATAIAAYFAEAA